MHVTFTEFKEIEEPQVKNSVPPEIELAILSAFGHAIIEFEETLFMKFQQLTKGIIRSKREFLEDLENMQEREIIVSGIFQGKKCWALGSDTTNIFD